MGDLGGEHAADGDRLAVAPVVGGGGLHGVGVGVPVVQDLPRPRLGEVLADHGGLDGHGARDELGERGRVPPDDVGGIGHHAVQDDRIGDEPALDDLAQPRPQLVKGERLENGQVAYDGRRRVEGADQVLARRGVDAGLPAHGRVDHGQEGGGDVDDGHAPQPGRRGEADQVGRRAPAHGDDAAVASHAHPTQLLPQRVQDGAGLGGLAARDGDPLDPQSGGAQPVLVPTGASLQLGDVDERHSSGAPAGRPGDAAHHVDCQVLPDNDLVGPRTEHRQAQSSVVPGPQGPGRRHEHAGTGLARPARTRARGGGGGRQVRQRARGAGGLGSQAHQDERGHLLGGQAVCGDSQRGDLGVQGRALDVEGLHPRQDRAVPVVPAGARVRRSLRGVQRARGGIGVRLGRHQRPARPVADVRGGRLGRGGKIHDRVPVQQGTVLLPQDGAPAQRHHALGGRRGVEHRAQGARLPHPESLLPLRGEDLRDGHTGAPTDLGVGVGDLQPEGRGEQARHRGLAGSGQPHQDQRKVLRCECDVRNETTAHHCSPCHWVRSAMRAR